MQEEKKSVWKELYDSIQFCIDSKKGKYSLETYLEILGEYTDRLILQEEQNGEKYVEGICTIKKSEEEGFFDFTVELFFKDSNNQIIKKEAARELPIEKFTRETENQIGNNTLKYKIDEPKEDKG